MYAGDIVFCQDFYYGKIILNSIVVIDEGHAYFFIGVDA